MGKRQYTQKEWKLLSWWLAIYHPRAEILMNVRVGPTLPLVGIHNPTPAEQQLSRVRNRWVDAIYLEHGVVTIVEAKIEPDPGIFSQLVHYARKFRADPTFAEFKNSELRLVALVYNDDPSVAMEAPWYGVQWVLFQPTMDGLLPPQLRGGPLEGIGSLLPQDWPSRLSALLAAARAVQS